MTGTQMIKLSKRSKMPPCPGMMFPLSLTPKDLFSWLSTKSPKGAKVATKKPTTIQFPRSSGKYFSMKNPNMSVKTTPPAKPSQVFFGEIFGAILCFPNKRPLKYAKESELQINTKSMKTSDVKDKLSLELYLGKPNAKPKGMAK